MMLYDLLGVDIEVVLLGSVILYWQFLYRSNPNGESAA